MKEGFLFGLGFSAAYFASDTAIRLAVHFLERWRARRVYHQQMKAIKEGNLAGGQAQAQTHREYNN